MLNGMLDDQNVVFLKEVSSWEEAVEISFSPLLKSGIIEKSYVDRVIANTKKYGPYYVLTEGLAMPHAIAEGDVKKTNFSLLILSQPIKFSDESFPVQAILALAAKDNVTHLDALRMIGTIFSDHENVDRLISCTSLTDVKKIFD